MYKEKITKIIAFLIEGSLLLLIFFLPLYFSFFYQAIPSFIINVAIDRTAVFKSAVALLVFLTLLRVVLEGELAIRASRKQLLAAGLVFCSAALATIFSADRHSSFWGSDTRQQGLLAAAYCLLFFLILVINITDRKQIERLISAALLAGSATALLGLLQWCGLDLLFRKPSLILDNRLGSTLGHPVFLGNFLLLTLALGGYKLTATLKKSWKIIYLLAVLAQLAALILTQSRGAWLGLIFGVISSGLIYFYYYRRRLLRPIFILMIIAAIIAAGLIYLNRQAFDTTAQYRSSAYSYAARLKSFFDLKSGSVALRLKYWPAAIKGFAQRPVFGYGPEAQYLPLFEAYNPSWMIYEKVNSTADRAHNEFLDILLTCGLVGLASYLFLLATFMAAAMKRFGQSQGSERWLYFFLLAGLLAYQGALFFNFSTIETKAYFWLYLGMLAVLLLEFRPAIKVDISRLWAGYRIALVYAAAMMAIIFPLLVLGHIDEVRADYDYQMAKFAERNGNYVSMINNYLEAIHLNNHDELYRADFAVALINSGITETVGQDRASTSLLEYLDEQLEFDRGLQDNYFRSLTRAIIYSIYGKYRDPSYYQRAEEIYQRLEKINPSYLNLHKNWALLYIQQGRFKEAIERNRKLFQYLPDLNDPYLNDEHRAQIGIYLADVYGNIAYAQAGLGLIDESIATNLYALRFNPTNQRLYKKIAELYLSQGKAKEAIFYCQHGLEIAPRDLDLNKLLKYINTVLAQ